MSKIKNYLLALFAIAAVATGVLAWNQYRELIKLRAAALDETARADLQKRLWALEKRNNELEAEVADLRSRQSGVAGADGNGEDGGDPAAPGEARGPGRFNRRGGFAGLTTLMDNPQFAKLWTDQQKARVNQAFTPLFKSLNLSPDQADKLQSLLAERQSSFMDALAAARSQGITNPGDIRQLVQQTNSQIDSQIQSLLGPDGYAQYTSYLQTMPQLNQVGQLQARLAVNGITPLQDYQVQQLTQVLAQNSTAASSGGGRGGGYFGGMGAMGGMLGTPVTGPTISSSAVSQAANVLTADQLQVLQQMQQEQVTQQQLRDALRQSFQQGQTAGAGGVTASSSTAPASTVRPVSRPPGS